MDWSQFKNFSEDEFKCQHTGHSGMDEEFLKKLQSLRTLYNKPMRITSGFRHPTHPIEKKKSKPGAHSTGHACDIACSGKEAFELIVLGLRVGMTGIGVSQRRGLPRFIHLDDIIKRPRPNIWSY
ncbi:MAG: putative peptidase M15 [Prokaryotic dsDNA virus sp.]|nr:MAG: putative peptidase M15 [Prokaryotic dsDNA virus sp.]|tara:strand:- start:10494 stop:10868 length:375 start_codon:yes stop_codon:yes gene_type:complete